MNYAVFYQIDLAGKLAPLMGSDSYVPIDGRLGIARQREAALEQVSRLKAVKPWIVAYQLRAGTIGNSAARTNITPVSAETAQAVKDAMAVGVVDW